MYVTKQQTFEASQRWLNMAIAYQTRAEKLSQKFDDPSQYPNSIFACYRGYARCMEMYDACWSHIEAMSIAYFRSKEYENSKEERKKLIADFQSEQDIDFVAHIGCIALILISILFADAWLSFFEWLAPHLF